MDSHTITSIGKGNDLALNKLAITYDSYQTDLCIAKSSFVIVLCNLAMKKLFFASHL